MTELGELSGAVALWHVATDMWTLGAAGVLYLIVRFAGRTIEATRSAALISAWRRTLPILPELIAVPIALVGGIPSVASGSVELRVAAGLWVAYLSGKAKKLIGQTMLGDDERIEAAIANLSKRDATNSKPPDNGRGTE